MHFSFSPSDRFAPLHMPVSKGGLGLGFVRSLTDPELLTEGWRAALAVKVLSVKMKDVTNVRIHIYINV